MKSYEGREGMVGAKRYFTVVCSKTSDTSSCAAAVYECATTPIPVGCLMTAPTSIKHEVKCLHITRSEMLFCLFLVPCLVCLCVADTRMGEVVCRTCGIVLGDRMIDDGAEWRSYNTDEAMHSGRDDPNRVGEWKSRAFDCLCSLSMAITGTVVPA